MSIDVSRSSRIVRPFLLASEDIKKLNELLSSHGASCSFEISCKDGLSRTYPTVNELLEFENPPKKQVESLAITARSKDRETGHYASLKFTNGSYDTIIIHLDGPEDIISKINNGIEDFFPRLKPWYGRLAVINYIVVAFGLLVIPIVVVYVALALGLVQTPEADPTQKSTKEFTQGTLKGSIAGMTILGIGYSLNRIRDRFFPMGVFAFGQGVARDKLNETIRRSILGSIGTSLLAIFGYLFRSLYL